MKSVWVETIGGVLMLSATVALAASTEQPIKDVDGRVMAVLVVCNDCRGSTESKKCHDGADRGFVGGKPCGQCLVKENAGTKFDYPYDLHFNGKLTDDGGNPVKDRFVKVFLANGWSVRTRTGDDGSYRLMLGAIGDRKSKDPMVTDVGTRVDSQKEHAENFSLYLLPEGYKPCTPEDAAAPKPKASHKPKKK
jgi:hypothetical protein